jgi:hypothetical protein
MYIRQVLNTCNGGKNSSQSINVYPNPTDKSINITYTSEYKGSETIIYNAFGQKVMNVFLDAEKLQKGLSLEAFPIGVYYIKVKDQTTKFIIVR